MEQHKFKVRLKESVYKGEAIHEEVLMVSEGHTLGMGILQGYDEPLFILKNSYVANTLLPYFDLLHNYEVIEITSENKEGRKHRNNHRRKTLLSAYS
jgi:hypothetical protein